MIHTLERFLEWGGVKKAVTCLVFSGIALLVSIFDLLPQLPFDAAWAAVVLCGIPIILEAVIGLVTAFDIKADVLVSIALIASLLIGEDFAAGEVAFIMQLGALLEDLTVAKARAGIEKLVHLTPQTARRLRDGGEEVIPAEQVAVEEFVERRGLKAGEGVLERQVFRRLAGKIAGHGFGGGVGVTVGERGCRHGNPQKRSEIGLRYVAQNGKKRQTGGSPECGARRSGVSEKGGKRADLSPAGGDGA
mgnify:CR=1 FL=1